MGDQLEAFMDDFLKEKSIMRIGNDSKTVKMNEEEVIVAAEESFNVEATPFVPENIDFYGSSDGGMSFVSSEDSYIKKVEYIEESMENHLQKSHAMTALKYEIDNNKILIQDLKSSVISLKVSTNRIENDVQDISSSMKKYSTDKDQLDNAVVDMEFRLNELLARHDDANKNNNDFIPENVTEDAVQLYIKEIVERIDGKIQQLDDKVTCIDEQNEAITNLALEIKRNENAVKEIYKALSNHQDGLNKIEKLQNLIEVGNQKENGEKISCKHLYNVTHDNLEEKVNVFIAKTETNEKSIETAWVGLIAALLLIPIAYFMGKLM